MIWHDVQQNGEEWDALRIGKVTASKFGVFMANEDREFGDPAKEYALQLALELLTGKKSESYSNVHMERGHEQEPIARMLYEQERFVTVANGGFFDYISYGDSPDGLIGIDGVIEIKSVIAKTHYATMRRGNFDPSYRWQLIGHLDCTDRGWVDFVSYCAEFPQDKQLIIHRLHKSDYREEINRLRRRREEFIHLVNKIVLEICEG